MANWLLVFIGGGLGSLCRYGIAQWTMPWQAAFPWATLIANALSCIILGFVFGAGWKLYQPTYYIFVASGFCGGFSTFSTFSNETVSLFQSNLPMAFANIFFNLLLCFVCIGLGILLSTPLRH